MELILGHLYEVWGLHPKDDSKRLLPATGADTSGAIGDDWIIDNASEILGYIIQNDGGILRVSKQCRQRCGKPVMP